jgi:hypothetical protein
MDCFTGSPTIDLTVSQPHEASQAVYETVRLARAHGLDDDDAEAVTAVARLWSSRFTARPGGRLHLRVLSGEPRGLEVVASHHESVDLGLPPSLPSTARSDQWNGPQGAAAMVRVGPSGPAVDGLFGVAQHVFRDRQFRGDAWALVVGSSAVTALVLDGLGHGPIASIASTTGVEAFLTDPERPIAATAQAIHAAMARTCGGVGAMGIFNALDNQLSFVGVGDISGRLIAPDGAMRGLASHPGILGVRQPPLRVLPYQAGGHLLVLHSDGVRDRWRLQDYPGLQYRHPTLIAALLHRDVCRDTDDGTILVVELSAFH